MAGYIGTTPVPQATQHRESFTATGGQTSFATAGYTPQFIDVYLNGVKLAPADYTATNGSDVVLASGATASDILEIVAYTPFEVANQTFTGDTSVTNLAVTGTFTSRGIDDNADAVAITIDSSENVGIGTSSPSVALEVNSGADNVVAKFESSDAGAFLVLEDSGSTSNGNHISVEGDNMSFATGNSNAMKIDSSGNLLVGKTSTGIGTAGIQAEATGQLNVTKSGDAAVRAIRLSSDGDIVKFYKDTTTVGSIGSIVGTRASFRSANTVGYLGVGSTDYYGFKSTAFVPTTTGSYDLGGSAEKFKDLYLSGSVYLGGTGSANALDDYEEGTWTPTVTYESSGGPATLATADGVYTKVGRVVTVSGIVSVSNTNSGSGQVKVGGLPFNVGTDLSSTGDEFTGSINYYTGFSSNIIPFSISVTSLNVLLVNYVTAATTTGLSLTAAQMGTGQFRFSATYFAT